MQTVAPVRNQVSMHSSGISFDRSVNLPLASGSNWTGTMFYNFNGDGNQVYAYAKTLPGNKYNIAIYDATDRVDIDYVPNITVGKENGAYIAQVIILISMKSEQAPLT